MPPTGANALIARHSSLERRAQEHQRSSSNCQYCARILRTPFLQSPIPNHSYWFPARVKRLLITVLDHTVSVDCPVPKSFHFECLFIAYYEACAHDPSSESAGMKHGLVSQQGTFPASNPLSLWECLRTLKQALKTTNLPAESLMNLPFES